MTIKVYVNDDYEVINENQFEERLRKKIAELDRYELCDLFDDWRETLPYNKMYQAYDLLVANDENRANILSEFREWVNTAMADELAEEWYEREIEV